MSIDTLNWLMSVWSAELREILRLMTQQTVEVTYAPEQDPKLEAGLWWSQALSLSTGDPVIMGAPAAVWSELGTATLQAAGVRLVEQSGAKSTYIEIISQVMSGFARAVAQRTQQQIDCTDGEEIPVRPTLDCPYSLTIAMNGRELQPIIVNFPSRLLTSLRGEQEKALVAPPAVQQSRELVGRARTMDLLMDVEMPVSISFGRSQLPLRDVLKLSTGSVIELNRQLNDSVEILVNNSVIARGQIVVVEGNYGVRIQDIASKQDRLNLQTGRGTAVLK